MITICRNNSSVKRPMDVSTKSSTMNSMKEAHPQKVPKPLLAFIRARMQIKFQLFNYGSESSDRALQTHDKATVNRERHVKS